MGLFNNAFYGDTVNRSIDSDFWYYNIAPPTASGYHIDANTAMTISAIYACVRVIAESVAQLPLTIYRRRPDGSGADEAIDHPLYDLLHHQPNRWQTSFEFREMMQGHLCLRGNAYAQIIMGKKNIIDELIPLHPDRIKVCMLENNRLVYKYKPPSGDEKIFRDYEIIHLRGLSSDGIVGINPIQMHSETIALAAAGRDYGARFFANDAQPRGIIQMQGTFDTVEKQKSFVAQWQDAQTGANKHKTAILEGGMEYKQLALNNRDSQFLESRKFQLEECARMFRMPPHLIQDLQNATYSNIEHQSINFVIHTVMPWLQRWEQALKRDLIFELDLEKNRNYFLKFNVDGLLRGDIESRYKAYSIAITNGFLTRNEVRQREDLNPIAGGDEMVTALNIGKINGDGGRDAGGNVPDTGAVVIQKTMLRRQAVQIEDLAEKENTVVDFHDALVAYFDSFKKQLRVHCGFTKDQAEQYCKEVTEGACKAYQENRITEFLDQF